MKTTLIPLSLAYLAQCQVTSPEAPKAVVTDWAKQVKANADSLPCERACAAIAEAVPQTFYLRDEGDFRLWDEKQRELTPACRIEPATPADVSVIVKAAAADNCHFAVRSGGHSRIAGSSNAEGGITIDLRRFDQVEVSKDKKTVKIGGGNTWGPVYRALEKDNLAVVGGRVSDVGVGGLLLGGGISLLSNRHGWGSDSIAAYEVVLPNGAITKVTHHSDPDLFWALRGGGNNFGVVTAFHLDLIERKPDVWRANAMYTLDKLDKLIDAQHDFIINQQSKDPDAVAWFPYCYHQAYDFNMVFPSLFHTAHSDNATWPAAFAEFEKIEATPDTTAVVVKPMSDMTDDIEQMSPPGLRTVYKTITYQSDPEVDKKIIAAFLELLEKFKTAEGLVPCVVLHPTPNGHTKPMLKNGGNPLGIADSGPLTIMMTAWTWKNAADDQVLLDTNKELFDRATKIAEDAGKLVPFIYQNYAWEDQDVFAGYGKENHERLKKVQKRIDPKGVFAGGEGLSRGYFKVNTKAASGDAGTSAERDEL